MFAANKQNSATSGKIGSIPFSGKSIPPDKFSSQYVSTPINKAFMNMLRLFNRICLGLLLKLKIAVIPIIADNKVIPSIIYLVSKSSTSVQVKCSATAQSTARSIKMDWIL